MEPTPLSNSATGPDSRLAETATKLVVPVIEERAVVHREVVERGRIRLSKTVHEQEQELAVVLQHEEAQVERVPVNQFVADGAAAPVARYEGDTLVVPIVHEVVVKRLLVVEELRIRKQQVETQHTHSVTLRHEEVKVERVSTENDPAAGIPTNI